MNHLSVAVDEVEPYEIKRYSSTDFFEKHTDNYYSLAARRDRKITMSIQLTDPDEYEGGEFVLPGKTVKLQQGSFIAFPSFFPHEITPIRCGTRWSLIGWAWGPNWR